MIRGIGRIDWRSLRVRILATTGAALALALGTWCWQSWRTDAHGLERDLRARLEAVAVTTSVAIDGDAHARLAAEQVPGAGETEAPSAYAELHDTLTEVCARNELEGELSTLVLRDGAAIESAPDRVHEGALELLVSSEDRPEPRRGVDYLPAMAPALFEGRASSSAAAATPGGDRLAAYAPLVDSFGSVAGIVRVSVPWSGSPLRAWLYLAGRIALSGILMATTLFLANQVVLRALLPLGKLEEAAGLLATGDWTNAVEVETNASELVVLSSALEGLRLGVTARLEEERRTNQRLIESKRVAEGSLAGQTEAVARLAGDVREPLARFTRALRTLESVPLEAGARREVEGALQEGYAISARLENALQLARLESLERGRARERFDLAELIERVAGPVRLGAQREELSFRVVVPETLPDTLVGDPGLLAAVLDQLLRNALAATEEGSITLRVWRTASRREELLLRFEVADTGSGISSQARERIERALRERMDFVHRERTALGLARASELVSRHGGELAFESRPGVGSRFWFFARFEEPALVAAGEQPSALPNREPREAVPAQSSAWIQGAS